MGIIEKANKLGLDIGDGSASFDNLRAIASQVGLNDFNSSNDVSKLDKILTEKLNSEDDDENIEDLYDSLNENDFFEDQKNQGSEEQGTQNNGDNKKEQNDPNNDKSLNNESQNSWKKRKDDAGRIKNGESNPIRQSKLNNALNKGGMNNIPGLKNPMGSPLGKGGIGSAGGTKAAKEAGKEAAKEAAKQATKEAVKKAAAQVGAKLATFIAANPWVLLIIGGVILLLLLLIVITGAAGGGNTPTNDFGLYGYDFIEVGNVCNTVKVYNPTTGTYTRELDFETEYVPGVVNAELGYFASNFEMAKLFSIAARTFALRNLSSDCTIEGSARKQAFTFNESSLASVTSEGSIVRQAADETHGLVFVKDGELAPTYYDAACYRGENDSYYLIGYGSITKDSEQTQQIPKSWAETQSGLMYYINASKSAGKYCYNNHGYGISQYGAYYLATEKSYDMDQLIDYYMSNVKLYSIYQGVSSNYTTSTSMGSTDILTMTLKEFLNSKGIAIEQYNEYILSNVINAGVGTRSGAVTAAVSLVGTLYTNYGVRLPYTMCGQHGCTDFYHNGVNVNRLADSFYGVDPNWGATISNTSSGVYVYGSGTYTRYGPDCSGFVAWVLHNSGFVGTSTLADDYRNFGTLHAVNSTHRAQPGDLMWTSGHIMFIVGVDESEQVYYIAHASGGSQGVKINTISFSTGGYYTIDMTSWYQTHSKGYSSEEFASIYRSGYVDGYTGQYDSMATSVNENIYLIGDSRTVGLCYVNSLCKSMSSCNTNMCFAKVGVGYTWFTSNKSVISKTSKKNIVINMGVNDLAGSSNAANVANNYFNQIESIATQNKSKKIYVMSVNPVENYSTIKNDTIISFNNKMRSLINESSLNNLYYINSYNSINFVTTDGLHYDSDTYKKLYKYILGVVR